MRVIKTKKKKKRERPFLGAREPHIQQPSLLLDLLAGSVGGGRVLGSGFLMLLPKNSSGI